MQALLFRKDEQRVVNKMQKKVESKFEQVGGEIKQRAEQFGNEMKSSSRSIRRDLSDVNVPRRGIGHAIGVLFKAFFLFISVVVTFALVTALIGVLFGGAGLLPLKNYFIQGFWQNIMVWGVAVLFLILPD